MHRTRQEVKIHCRPECTATRRVSAITFRGPVSREKQRTKRAAYSCKSKAGGKYESRTKTITQSATCSGRSRIKGAAYSCRSKEVGKYTPQQITQAPKEE